MSPIEQLVLWATFFILKPQIKRNEWKSRPLVNADAFLLTNRGSEASFRCQVSGVRCQVSGLRDEPGDP
jgi:hypothetical protein